MIIINFAHPLTESHLREISIIGGEAVEEVIEIDSSIDTTKPITPQVLELINKVKFTKRDWQTNPILLNLPSLNYTAAILISEIHGRSGHFPAFIRMRPVKEAAITKFEVAEIVDLQTVRNTARARDSIQP